MSTTDKLYGLEPYVYDENEIIHEHDFDMKLLSEGYPLDNPKLGKWEMFFTNRFYYFMVVMYVDKWNEDGTRPLSFTNPLHSEVMLMQRLPDPDYTREDAYWHDIKYFVKGFAVPVDDGKPELTWMSQPYSWPLEKRKSIRWAEAKTIPSDFYKTARSLMKADEMVREFFPGWCVIKNKPVLEVPDNYRPD